MRRAATVAGRAIRLAWVVGALGTAACTTLPPRLGRPTAAVGEPVSRRIAQAYAGTRFFEILTLPLRDLL